MYPIASLVKVPLATAVLARVEDGRIDLLEALWVPSRIPAGVAARTRSLLGGRLSLSQLMSRVPAPTR